MARSRGTVALILFVAAAIGVALLAMFLRGGEPLPLTSDDDEFRSLVNTVDTFEYFVRDGASWVTNHPSFPDTGFPARKDPDELRVFLAGGSQLMGRPYVRKSERQPGTIGARLTTEQPGGIGTWLAEYLRQLHPDRKIRVVNAASSIVTPLATAPILEQIVNQGSPDIVVVSLDNAAHLTGSKWSNLAEFTSAQRRGRERFQQELARILAILGKLDGQVFVLTSPANLRDARPNPAAQPFTDEEIDEILEQIEAGVDLELPAEIEGHALYAYMQAKRAEAAGDIEAARELYGKARDRDVGLQRLPASWNEVIRGIEHQSVGVIDIDAKIRAFATDGLPGEELFVDQRHLNLTGSLLVAREIALAYQRARGLAAVDLQPIDMRAPFLRALRALFARQAMLWRSWTERFPIAPAPDEEDIAIRDWEKGLLDEVGARIRRYQEILAHEIP